MEELDQTSVNKNANGVLLSIHSVSLLARHGYRGFSQLLLIGITLFAIAANPRSLSERFSLAIMLLVIASFARSQERRLTKIIDEIEEQVMACERRDDPAVVAVIRARYKAEGPMSLMRNYELVIWILAGVGLFSLVS